MTLVRALSTQAAIDPVCVNFCQYMCVLFHIVSPMKTLKVVFWRKLMNWVLICDFSQTCLLWRFFSSQFSPSPAFWKKIVCSSFCVIPFFSKFMSAYAFVYMYHVNMGWCQPTGQPGSLKASGTGLSSLQIIL